MEAKHVSHIEDAGESASGPADEEAYRTFSEEDAKQLEALEQLLGEMSMG